MDALALGNLFLGIKKKTKVVVVSTGSPGFMNAWLTASAHFARQADL